VTQHIGSNAPIYLHGDHLGSISVATNSSGAQLNSQEFDPWGKVRLGGVSQTSLNYTGQILDGTLLLYYHARMYDPNLGRFVSADSIVPGVASGAGGGAATLGLDASQQLKPLTVDFHETGFVSKLNAENGFGFWFQLSDDERQQAGSPWGPLNPQALNRYSYVLNNPLRYTDPSGHWTLSVGFTFRIGLLGGASFSAGATIDGQGNLASYTTTSHSSLTPSESGNLTVGAIVGGSIGGGLTTADTIDETEGKSGAIGLDGAVLGKGGIDIINPQNIGTGKGYIGGSGGIGLGLGADWHAELTNTTLYNKVNVPNTLKRIYDQGEDGLRRLIIPPNFR
jgi:RHS repeat-associated protein